MNKREFFRFDRKFEPTPLHYTQCGLDDIYLLNGFTRRSTAYGAGMTVSNINDLHRTIGLYLIMDRKALTPKELRFLRKQMRMTQGQLARRLRLSDQQVARWEKGESEISGSAETLIRMLYVLYLLPRRKHAQFLNELKERLDDLSQQDDRRPRKAVFQETDEGWIKAILPPAHQCAMAMA